MNDRIEGRMRALPDEKRRRHTITALIALFGLIVFAELCYLAYAIGYTLGSNHL